MRDRKPKVYAINYVLMYLRKTTMGNIYQITLVFLLSSLFSLSPFTSQTAWHLIAV